MSTIILATRFNNLQNRLAAVLGTSDSATPTFGYGQPLNADFDVAGTRSNTIPNSDKITAQQYEDLYIDIIRCRAHQVGVDVAINEFVLGNYQDPSVTDPGDSADKIEEAYISGLESLMTVIEANRFIIDTAEQSTTTNLLNSSGAQITSTYRQSISGSWTSFLNQIFSVTFPSAASRRHFFNSGGEIRLSAGVTYTGAQRKTADWQSAMAAMGVISFTADDTFSNSSVGSSTNVGNNNLTNTYKLCYRKDAGLTYSQSAYELYALQTGDRTIQFKVLFTDPNPGGFSIDEAVFGDWTSSATLLVPDGSVTINGTIYDTVVINNEQLPIGSTIVQLSAANPPTPSYSLSRSQATVSEGSSASITLTTTNVSNGTVIPYTITGVSANDINIPLDGQFVVGTTNTVTIVFAADLVTEGTETFRLALSNGAANISITVSDTSLTPPTAGTLLSQACQGVNLVGTYANGTGGTYTQLIEANSPTCGYQPPFTFSVSPTAYTSQATAWDIGDVVVNTESSTSITVTNTSTTTGTITVQDTTRPLEWDVAVDGVSTFSENVASVSYSVPGNQSISVPISVIPRTVTDFASINRTFDFTVVGSNGVSRKIYWTGTGIAAPGVPTINSALTANTVSGNETTTSTIVYSGTVSNWTAATGAVYWQTLSGSTNANDFVGGQTSGSASVIITNSPETGDGTYSFTRSIRADQTTEGSESFGTQVFWPQINPSTSSQERIVSIADTSQTVPITASFSNTTHTFSLIPGQTETWSTTVAINSSPNNNPVTLTASFGTRYGEVWDVKINNSPVIGYNQSLAAGYHTFTLTPGQTETITISVKAVNGPAPQPTAPSQIILYQGNAPYSGSTILSRLYYNGSVGNWTPPVIKSAGISPSNAVVGVPATLYYTTENTTQVQYIITGTALPAGVAQTYDIGVNGLNIRANVDDITFTNTGTANWSIIASTPDGQTDTRSGTVTVTSAEPEFSVSLPNGTSYEEGDTITFSLRYKNATSSSKILRFFRNPNIGETPAPEYSFGGNGVAFSGLNTAQDNVFRTATATITAVVDANVEGTESFYLSDDTAVPSYATWTLSDQPVFNGFAIAPNPVSTGAGFSIAAVSVPNTTATYTATSVPDYNQPGGTLSFDSAGKFSARALHTAPGVFTYNITFSAGTPLTRTYDLTVCPVLSISGPSSVNPGESFTFTITGGVPNGSYSFSRVDASGTAILSFDATGSATVNTVAPSTPGTYTYSITESLCNRTSNYTVVVNTIYSPTATFTPANPVTDQDITVTITGGRPNGAFALNGLSGTESYTGLTFNSSGNFSITGAYATAGTKSYNLSVPTPDVSSSFSIPVAQGVVYDEKVSILQQLPGNSQVSCFITDGQPGTGFTWTATGTSPTTGSGTLNAGGAADFLLTPTQSYFNGGITVTFTGTGNVRTASAAYTAPTYSMTAITNRPDANNLILEGQYNATFTVTTTNVANGTVLYWSTSGTGITADDFTDNTLTGTVTINNNTGTFIRSARNDSNLEGFEVFSVTLRTGSTSGPGVASSSIGISPGVTPPNPTIQFLADTYTIGTTIQASANPDSAGGTYSSTTRIVDPNNNIIASSLSIQAHTLSATATVAGTYTALISVLYRGNSGEQLGPVGTKDTAVVTSPQPSVSLSANKTSVNEGDTITFTLTYANLTSDAVKGYLSGAGVTADDRRASVFGSTLLVGFYGLTTGAGTSGTKSATIIIAADELTEGPETAIYTITNPNTASVSFTINDTSQSPAVPPTISFTPSSGIINSTAYTLSWNANGAPSATVVLTNPNQETTTFTNLTNSISNALGVVGTWTATITTAGGTRTASVTVSNPPPPAGTGSINFDQSSYFVGETIVANYTTTNASTVIASISRSGTNLVTTNTKPNGSLAYEALTAGTYGAGLSVNGTVVSTDTVSVSNPPPPPAAPDVGVYFTPSSGTTATTFYAGWYVTGSYTSITATGNIAGTTIDLGSSATGSFSQTLPAGTHSLTVVATGPGGTTTRSDSVVVSG